jgi:hypothetical protein
LLSGAVINAPDGIGISSGNVSNPTVNNEIHQSAVEISGSGTTSGVTIINPTVTGTPSGKKSGSLVSFDSSSGKISDFAVKDAHLCNFNSWDDFLDRVAADPPGVN